MKYLPDADYTAERIADLAAEVEQARYELAAAIMVAKPLGLTWSKLGDALGMTKQGAGQFARRQMALGTIDDVEHERLCRFLGIGDRVPRYEVRRIVSGRVGLTKVERETISVHLRRYVAEGVADRYDGGEVWELAPDGTSRQLNIRRHDRRTDRPARVPAELADW